VVAQSFSLSLSFFVSAIGLDQNPFSASNQTGQNFTKNKDRCIDFFLKLEREQVIFKLRTWKERKTRQIKHRKRKEKKRRIKKTHTHLVF
jgi:hypothetical protein